MGRGGSTEYGAMHVAVRALPPAGPWRAGWRFHAAGWPSSVVPSSVSLPFRTLDVPGDFAPANGNLPWSFHLGLRKTAAPVQARLLASGFQIGEHACCIARADGSVVGCAPEGAQPVLFSTEHEIQQLGQTALIDTGSLRIALALRHLPGITRFALVPSPEAPETVISAAAQALDTDPQALLDAEWTRRSAFWEECDAPPELLPGLARSVETLVAHLRPPVGGLPGRWSCATPEHTDLFCISQLLELVAAWRAVDPAVAAELVRSALACQQPDGSLPSLFRPANGAISDTPAWPVVAQAALLACEAGDGGRFLPAVVPALERYLSWALAHYLDPASGHHRWRSEGEAMIPEVFDASASSADLPALLLAELDAFAALTARMGPAAAPPAAAMLQEERDRMAAHLEDVLWDEAAGDFRDRFADGSRVERASLSALLPLLWGDLNAKIKERLVARAEDTAFLRGEEGWRLWAAWEDDDEAPPFSAAHHTILLLALRGNAPREAWQAAARAVAASPRLLEASPGRAGHPEARSSPVRLAALHVVAVEAIEEHTGPAAASSRVRWMDRHRVAIIAVCVGAVGLAVAAVAGVMAIRSQRAAEADSLAVLAHQHYNHKDYAAAIPIYESILESYRDRATVEFRLANAYHHQKDYARSEQHYRNVLQDRAMAAKALMNLGLTLYRQGRPQEAAGCYEEVIRRFADYQPQAVARARTALEIVRREQQSKAPP